MKKLLLAVVAVVGGVVVARRLKAGQDERSLWHEATTAPDLR
ncbi:MAG: DLW-39 family protein [Pseudonocardiales bacterium]